MLIFGLFHNHFSPCILKQGLLLKVELPWPAGLGSQLILVLHLHIPHFALQVAIAPTHLTLRIWESEVQKAVWQVLYPLSQLPALTSCTHNNDQTTMSYTWLFYKLLGKRKF